MSVVEVDLDPVADSVPVAREVLEELREVVGADRLEDLRLVVSELVTNSVRHAGLGQDDAIGLRVSTNHVIRVEIHDAGPGFQPKESTMSMYQDSGWGLFLIARIADRWGVSTDEDGTTVWLEIDR